jgi:hypothetical protein
MDGYGDDKLTVSKAGESRRLIYNPVVILVCWCFFFLPALALAQIAGKVMLYNSAYDYFEGDQLEYVTHQQILKELKHYPPAYALIGLGAVIQGDWTGAVIVSGTVAEPLIRHTTPEKPHLFRPLSQTSFPWLQLAVCNPRRKLERRMRGIRSIHRFIANQLQNAGNIKLAAIKVNGTLTNISYTPQPVVKNPSLYPRKLKVSSPQEWELIGLYFRDYELQLAGAISGGPVILFGINTRQNTGGCVQMASVIEAKAVIYPLMEYQLRQSDLSVVAARLDTRRNEKLLVRVKNGGQLDVRQVQLKMTVPGTTIEDETTVSIPAREEIIVKFNNPAKFNPGYILFQIDPQGLVRESREDNNLLEFYLNRRR